MTKYVWLISDYQRAACSMSTDIAKTREYDKLEKALLSGLPNEVDFAINVCMLLSNEGRHVLRLDKSPFLLELLMAHIGLFRDGKYHDFFVSLRGASGY